MEDLGTYLKVKVKVIFSLKQATKDQRARCMCADSKYFLVSKITLQKYGKDPTGQADSQLCGGNYIGSVLTVAHRGGFGVSTTRNSEGPPKSSQTQPDCENCLKIAEFRTPKHQDVRKKGSKILKLTRFAIVLH